MRRIFLLIGVLALLGAGTVSAQRANDGVCDGLENSTPGLFGLCIAFCEAHDCDFDEVSTGQCLPSDPVLVGRYNALKKPNDPDLPCLEPPMCPCFTAVTIQEVEAPFNICLVDVNQAAQLITSIQSQGPMADFASVADRTLNDDNCSIRFTQGGDTIFRSFRISEPEFDVCKAILVAHMLTDPLCPTNVPSGTADGTFRDEFNAASVYDGNDGTETWSGPWVDYDTGADNIQVDGKFHCAGDAVTCLRIQVADLGDYIYREADLSGVGTASLRFYFEHLLQNGEQVAVEASGDGGASYAVLTTLDANTPQPGTASLDLSEYLAADTRIRFRVAAVDGNHFLWVDNVEIEFELE